MPALAGPGHRAYWRPWSFFSLLSLPWYRRELVMPHVLFQHLFYVFLVDGCLLAVMDFGQFFFQLDVFDWMLLRHGGRRSFPAQFFHFRPIDLRRRASWVHTALVQCIVSLLTWIRHSIFTILQPGTRSPLHPAQSPPSFLPPVIYLEDSISSISSLWVWLLHRLGNVYWGSDWQQELLVPLAMISWACSYQWEFLHPRYLFLLLKER